MKKLVVIALALFLAGCGTNLPFSTIPNPFVSHTNPVTKDGLAKLEAGYGAALSVANIGRQACAARQLPPICRTLVKQAQNADAYAYNQIVVLRGFVKNNPSIDASVLISTAQSAVDAYADAAKAIKGAP